MNEATFSEPTAVWLVGDDLNALELAGRCLQSEAWQVRILGPSAALRELEQGKRPLVTCVEVGARTATLLDLIASFRTACTGLRCVLIEGDVDLGLQRPSGVGALEVVAKPVQRSRLVGAVSRAAELSRLDYRVAQLERELDRQEGATESGVACIMPEETLNLRELERETITRAIHRADGCMSRAAKLLGIGRATIYRKLASYDSDPREALDKNQRDPSPPHLDALQYASDLS